MTLKILLIIFLLFNIYPSNAQKEYVLSGNISDAATGESLSGATVLVEDLPNTGTVSNNYGFYSLSLPAGKYVICYQIIGYETFTIYLNINESCRITNSQFRWGGDAIQL